MFAPFNDARYKSIGFKEIIDNLRYCVNPVLPGELNIFVEFASNILTQVATNEFYPFEKGFRHVSSPPGNAIRKPSYR